MASNESVRVEQCDREAAAAMAEACIVRSAMWPREAREGERDDDEMVIAFARHRTLSQADGRGEVGTDERCFIAAAIDFSDAGPERFKPGYNQYRDLALAASRLAALTEVQQEKNDG